MFITRYFLLSFVINVCASVLEDDCGSGSTCGKNPASTYLPRYLFYDVNPPEGFNLRRDVYIRLGVFMKILQSAKYTGHWHLVLPPWSHLYHWRSISDVGVQRQIPWNEFFDVDSMKRYAPVVELYEVLNEIKNLTLDATIVLQHFKEAFSDSWSWEDKWDFDECHSDSIQWFTEDGDSYKGNFWGYSNISTKELFCVSFQGQASKIKEILDSVDRRLVMIDHAEIVLHDWFGNAEYWRCRRSMRFASHLVSAAAEFRLKYFNSTDETDKTVVPDKWEDETIHRNAIGGNYLAVHLRRRDFKVSRQDEIPNLEQAVKQISDKLEELKLDKVFIATDAPSNFIESLKTKLSNYETFNYETSLDVKKRFRDGGLAIIDQIICSRSRYFLGSYESTFSFRIQEEREILGFPVTSTFNRLCGSKIPCDQPTKWLIAH